MRLFRKVSVRDHLMQIWNFPFAFLFSDFDNAVIKVDERYCIVWRAKDSPTGFKVFPFNRKEGVAPLLETTKIAEVPLQKLVSRKCWKFVMKYFV